MQARWTPYLGSWSAGTHCCRRSLCWSGKRWRPLNPPGGGRGQPHPSAGLPASSSSTFFLIFSKCLLLLLLLLLSLSLCDSLTYIHTTHTHTHTHTHHTHLCLSLSQTGGVKTKTMSGMCGPQVSGTERKQAAQKNLPLTILFKIS